MNTTTFDPESYKQSFKTKMKTTIFSASCSKQESEVDAIKADATDEVVRTVSLAETKGHAIPYSYHINEKGKIDFVMPLELTKAQRNKMKAEAQTYGRKFEVMRRLQERMREKGLEVKALPPIVFK